MLGASFVIAECQDTSAVIQQNKDMSGSTLESEVSQPEEIGLFTRCFKYVPIFSHFEPDLQPVLLPKADMQGRRSLGAIVGYIPTRICLVAPLGCQLGIRTPVTDPSVIWDQNVASRVFCENKACRQRHSD